MDKPEDSLKKDLVFTGSTFDNLDMKKKKSKNIYGHVQRGYLKFFLSSKWKKITNSLFFRKYSFSKKTTPLTRYSTKIKLKWVTVACKTTRQS